MLFHIFNTTSGWFTIVAIIGFLCAITIALTTHEWAHAWAAYKSGDPTAKMMGRMTLNPAKHVEPMGAVMFLIAGIGWAKPVPVNPFNYRNFKRGNFFVSIAGVTVNLIIGFFSSLFFYIIIRFGDPSNVGIWGLAFFFQASMFINFTLMIFNLLPFYPLDGYNLLRSFTKPNNKYMHFMRQHSQAVLIIMLLVIVFTGVIGRMVNGISDGFEWFWGLMF
ncbi:MAG: site-2 protease family protein [Firmicutes bacterium]|nr:site-2 protease family protein [Bacillota bacterium]